MMFCGLTSRWIRPAAWAASRAAATPPMMNDARAGRQRPGTQQLLQRLAVDEPHVDVGVAVDLTPVVNRNHVWFLKNCGRPRLALETRPELLVLPELLREDLQRDGAALLRVFRPVHLAHAAPAEQAGESVVAEHLADTRAP